MSKEINFYEKALLDSDNLDIDKQIIMPMVEDAQRLALNGADDILEKYRDNKVTNEEAYIELKEILSNTRLF